MLIQLDFGFQKVAVHAVRVVNGYAVHRQFDAYMTDLGGWGVTHIASCKSVCSGLVILELADAKMLCDEIAKFEVTEDNIPPELYHVHAELMDRIGDRGGFAE